jgi:hypothetical protein
MTKFGTDNTSQFKHSSVFPYELLFWATPFHATSHGRAYNGRVEHILMLSFPIEVQKENLQ